MGAAVSLTVIVKLVPDELPRVSLALHDTVFGPSGNVAPAAGTHVTGRVPSTRSVATGLVKVMTAPLGPVASAVTFDAAPNDGPVVSWTVIENEPFAMLPAVSVAEQFTIVVPSAKVEPDAGRQVTAGIAGFASVAVAVKETVRPAAPVASTVRLAGRFSVGGVVSHEITVADALIATVRLRTVLLAAVPEIE